MKIAGLILAGGQAQRMGGVDKGLQLLNGKPLVQHVIERVAPQVDELWLCANRHLDAYQSLGYPVFSDEVVFQGVGPLAGIASFAEHIHEAFTHIQICPCDTPFLPLNMCAYLKQRLKTISAFRSTINGVFPKTELGAHYGCALVTRAQLSLAQRCLQNQRRSVQSWLKQAHAVPVIGFIESDFANINTLEQLTHTHHLDCAPHHLFEANHA